MGKLVNPADTLMVNLKELPQNVEDDIREYCENNKKYSILENGFMVYNEAIFCYLEHNGAHGYTNDLVGIIVNIFKKNMQ